MEGKKKEAGRRPEQRRVGLAPPSEVGRHLLACEICLYLAMSVHDGCMRRKDRQAPDVYRSTVREVSEVSG